MLFFVFMKSGIGLVLMEYSSTYIDLVQSYNAQQQDLDALHLQWSDLRQKLSNNMTTAFNKTPEYCDLCRQIKAKKAEYSATLDALIKDTL